MAAPTLGPFGTPLQTGAGGLLDLTGADQASYAGTTAPAGRANLRLVSNQLAGTTTATSCRAYVPGQLFGPNAEIWGQINAIGANGSFLDFMSAWSNPGQGAVAPVESFIEMEFDPLAGTDTVTGFAIQAGVTSNAGIGLFTTQELVAGDYWGFGKQVIYGKYIYSSSWKWDSTNNIWVQQGGTQFTPTDLNLLLPGLVGFEVSSSSSLWRWSNMGFGTMVENLAQQAPRTFPTTKMGPF